MLYKQKEYVDAQTKKTIACKASIDLIEKIKSFLEESPEVIKDSSVYPDEKNFYIASSIMKAINTDDVKFTLAEVQKALFEFSSNVIGGIQHEGKESGEWGAVLVKNPNCYSYRTPAIQYYYMFYKNSTAPIYVTKHVKLYENTCKLLKPKPIENGKKKK